MIDVRLHPILKSQKLFIIKQIKSLKCNWFQKFIKKAKKVEKLEANLWLFGFGYMQSLFIIINFYPCHWVVSWEGHLHFCPKTTMLCKSVQNLVRSSGWLMYSSNYLLVCPWTADKDQKSQGSNVWGTESPTEWSFPMGI